MAMANFRRFGSVLGRFKWFLYWVMYFPVLMISWLCYRCPHKHVAVVNGECEIDQDVEIEVSRFGIAGANFHV
jgi:hypothetical protein